MPVAINGVDEQGVAVNGVQVKQALDAANEIVSKGVYDPTTLSAVEVDLAVGNIADGVTIFGFAGTVVAGTLAEDVEGDTLATQATDTGASGWRYQLELVNNAEVSLASKTLTFDASSIAFAAGFTAVMDNAGADVDLRFYMDGVLMQTSADLTNASLPYVLRDFKVLSGSKTCELKIKNDAAGTERYVEWFGENNVSIIPAAIAVGSVKLA